MRSRPEKRGDPRIWAAILLGLVLRAGLLFAVGDIACVNDECSYLKVAHALLDGQGLLPIRGFLWAPGYPAFLALAGAWSAASMTLGAKVLQVGLAVVTHLLLAAWARRCFGKDAALSTAWLFAFYPTLIAFTHYVWPETLYIFFIVLGFGALFKALQSGERTRTRFAPFLGSGAAFGLAALVRPIAFYFLFFVVLWMIWWGRSWFEGRGSIAAFVLGCALVIAPWTMRNWAEYGELVAIDATLGVNLWRGNATPAVANWDFGFDRRPRDAGIPRGFPECQALSLIERDRCNTLRSLLVIKENPGRFLRRLPTKMLDLANPTSFLLRHARWGLYGSLSRGAISLLTVLVIASFASVSLLGILGLVGMPVWISGRPLAMASRQLVLALGLYTLIVHSITFGMSRYRLPLITLVLPFAALAWSRRHELSRLSRSRWRLVLMLWLLLLAGWARRLPPLLDLDPAITGPPPRLRPSVSEISTNNGSSAGESALSRSGTAAESAISD